MKDLEAFLALFSDQEITSTIEQLAHQFFVEKLWIASGLQLTYQKKGDLSYYLLEQEKLNQYQTDFVIFGQATNSGCLYAFYKRPAAQNCEEWPILVLGDQGGTVVLAKHIFDLFRFWTLNTKQPYVNSLDCETFDFEVNSADYETLEALRNNSLEKDNSTYKEWIKTSFGLTPLASLEEAQKTILQPATALYQKEIDAIFYE